MRSRFVVLAIALLSVALTMAPSAAVASETSPTAQDMSKRDTLIANQENLLNTYRCMFSIDLEAVKGGCTNGKPTRTIPDPGPYIGNLTQEGLALRDILINNQEILLNTYRCQQNIDTEIVPRGCAAFQSSQIVPTIVYGTPGSVWSPDSTRIASFRSIANVDGTQRIDIHSVRIGGNCSITWSPDGTAVALRTYDGLEIVDPDGTDLAELNISECSMYSWSPDSTRILYRTYDGGLWVVTANGADKFYLGSGLDAKWSPDSSRIAIVAKTSSERHELIVINADGTGRRKLTDLGHHGASIAWSPEGTRIAFTNSGLNLINADGTGFRKISRGISYSQRCEDGSFRSTTAWGAPAWSPDGKQIAFRTTDLGRIVGSVDPQDGYVILGIVAIINSDGSNPRNLATAEDGTKGQLQWLPDSKHLIFSTAHSEFVNRYGHFCGIRHDPGIYMVDTNGHGQTTIATGTTSSVHSFSLSPDGAMILVSEEVSPLGNNGTYIPSDRAILIGLYNATNGSKWAKNTNWNTNTPLNTWHGVLTDATGGRVTQLILAHNNLAGTIPKEIGNLTQLTHLDLASNSLTGTIPAEIGKLTHLTHLDLVGHRLTGTIPTEIGNLTQLTHLNLSGYGLTGAIPISFSALANLEYFYIAGNKLCLPPILSAWHNSIENRWPLQTC